jgi:hypothetical protein
MRPEKIAVLLKRFENGLGHSLFANSECISAPVVLKPQDVVIVLKHLGYGRSHSMLTIPLFERLR